MKQRINYHRIEPGWGVFSVDDRDRDTEDFYYYRRLRTEGKLLAYEVFKLTRPQPYHLRVIGPTTSKCECWQFERKGDCRHVEAMIQIHFLQVKPGDATSYDPIARG